VRFRAGDRMTDLALSDKAVVRLVTETAEALGETSRAAAGLEFGALLPRYSGHSLRAGLATAAAELEAQLHDIMRQTRHKSVEVARRYKRCADLWRNNVTAAPTPRPAPTAPRARVALARARARRKSLDRVATGSLAAPPGSRRHLEDLAGFAGAPRRHRSRR
jgi:hypothetical protein